MRLGIFLPRPPVYILGSYFWIVYFELLFTFCVLQVQLYSTPIQIQTGLRLPRPSHANSNCRRPCPCDQAGHPGNGQVCGCREELQARGHHCGCQHGTEGHIRSAHGLKGEIKGFIEVTIEI